MGHRLEKNMKIMEELISFCAKRGGRDIDIKFTLDKNDTKIKIACSNATVNDDDMYVLKQALCSDRQHEVEECFWHISGEDSYGDELTLTGIMVDSGEVVYKNGNLEIKVKRIED